MGLLLGTPPLMGSTEARAVPRMRYAAAAETFKRAKAQCRPGPLALVPHLQHGGEATSVRVKLEHRSLAAAFHSEPLVAGTVAVVRKLGHGTCHSFPLVAGLRRSTPVLLLLPCPIHPWGRRLWLGQVQDAQGWAHLPSFQPQDQLHPPPPRGVCTTSASTTSKRCSFAARGGPPLARGGASPGSRPTCACAAHPLGLTGRRRMWSAAASGVAAVPMLAGVLEPEVHHGWAAKQEQQLPPQQREEERVEEKGHPGELPQGRDVRDADIGRGAAREGQDRSQGAREQEQVEGGDRGRGGTEVLLREGQWEIRSATQGELRAVARVQARVFHEPPAVAALDSFFLAMFEAEVYDVLKSKVQRNSPYRYTCLIAVPSTDGDVPSADLVQDESVEQGKGEGRAQRKGGVVEEDEGKGRSKKFQGKGPRAEGESPGQPVIVGVVDACSLEESSVLCHLPHGARQYLYLTGMAVDAQFRRERVGSLLLAAAEQRALRLGIRHLALHVHEDNTPARALYTRAGYAPVFQDPWWTSLLPGLKSRLLMAKALEQGPSSS